MRGEDGIIEQDYSLNPGRYVGVVIEDDGVTEAEHKNHILSLREEFKKLNEESYILEKNISDNFEELLGQ